MTEPAAAALHLLEGRVAQFSLPFPAVWLGPVVERMENHAELAALQATF